MKSITELIKCATRELEIRRRAYPGWVNIGMMTQTQMDHEIACQQAIVAVLEDEKDRAIVADAETDNCE